MRRTRLPKAGTRDQYGLQRVPEPASMTSRPKGATSTSAGRDGSTSDNPSNATFIAMADPEKTNSASARVCHSPTTERLVATREERRWSMNAADAHIRDTERRRHSDRDPHVSASRCACNQHIQRRRVKRPAHQPRAPIADPNGALPRHRGYLAGGLFERQGGVPQLRSRRVLVSGPRHRGDHVSTPFTHPARSRDFLVTPGRSGGRRVERGDDPGGHGRRNERRRDAGYGRRHKRRSGRNRVVSAADSSPGGNDGRPVGLLRIPSAGL